MRAGASIAVDAADRRRRLLLWASWGLAAAMVFLLLRTWQPPIGPEYAVCLSRRLFRLPCPLCGMTRAWIAIARGELCAAVALHPLAPLVLAQAIAVWVAAFFQIRSGRPVRIPLRLVVANVGVLLALWIGRLVTGTLPI